VEGQTPPALKDMSNLYGKVEQQTLTQNEEINKRNTQEDKSPSIDRVTVSVNIDGRWKIKYNAKGQPEVSPDNSIQREYIPIPDDELKKAQALVQDAVGFNKNRGDSVTVQNIQFDRTKQFSDEDSAFLRQKQFQTSLMYFLVALAVLLVAFIVFRLVSRGTGTASPIAGRGTFSAASDDAGKRPAAGRRGRGGSVHVGGRAEAA